MKLRYSLRFLLALPLWFAIHYWIFRAVAYSEYALLGVHIGYLLSALPLANIVAIGYLSSRANPLATTIHVDSCQPNGKVSLLNVAYSSSAWALIVTLGFALCRPALYEYCADVLVWDQMNNIVSMLGLSQMAENPKTGVSIADECVFISLLWFWYSIVPLVSILVIQLCYLTIATRLRLVQSKAHADVRCIAITMATPRGIQPRRTRKCTGVADRAESLS